MCFSAEASFGASGVILAAGVVSIAKARKRSQVPFAAIPLIFSVQQAIEGLLWVALSNSEYAQWRSPATYFFLFFAQIIWPLWVPFSLLLLESHTQRKRILRGFLCVGALISAYFAYRLVFWGAQAHIVSHHITYENDFPFYWVILSGVFYVAATLLPPFVSQTRKMAVFGSSLTASFIVTILFYYQFLTSVWCFFAALMSVVIIFVVRELPAAATVRLPKS